MTREKLQLNRKFLVIESPIPFEIYCPEQDDGVKRRQGSWQMTIHDLLTTSHYPLNPIYNLELIYDDTLLKENEVVSWYTTDLNLGEALRGIDGQLVVWDYNERLGVTDVFNSLNGRGVSRFYIDSNMDFEDIKKLLNGKKLFIEQGVFFSKNLYSGKPVKQFRMMNDKIQILEIHYSETGEYLGYVWGDLEEVCYLDVSYISNEEHLCLSTAKYDYEGKPKIIPYDFTYFEGYIIGYLI